MKVVNIKYMSYSLREIEDPSALPKEVELPPELENYHIENGELIDESAYDIEEILVIKVTNYLNDITKCDIEYFEIITEDGRIVDSASF